MAKKRKTKKVYEEPALICGGKDVTYKELVRKAKELKEKKDS